MTSAPDPSSMSQTGGRLHNKKASIRAAVILIGLLHKSRKAKEKEGEKEESEGWVKPVFGWMTSGQRLHCSGSSTKLHGSSVSEGPPGPVGAALDLQGPFGLAGALLDL